MKTYKATGFVLGKHWGGGLGAYPSRLLQAKTKKTLLKKAKKELKSGGLDSGMGFESLKGALINIEEIETVNIKGKIFNRSEWEGEFIGSLTLKEEDFLLTL